MISWILFATLSLPESETAKAFLEARTGCFEVSYQFFDNRVKESDFTETAKEFIALEWLGENHASLQHIAIGLDPDDPNSTEDSVAIHWREEWELASKVKFSFLGNKTWKKEPSAADESLWSYRVYQIDGSLRTEYRAPIERVAGKTIFKASADAPLPRREMLAKRPENLKYQIMDRFQTITLNSMGFDELLSASKVKLSEKGREVVGLEAGVTQYKRLADSECALGAKLWEEQKTFWTEVRKAWASIYETDVSTIQVKSGRLIGEFMGLASSPGASKADSLQLRKKIEEVIVKSE